MFYFVLWLTAVVVRLQQYIVLSERLCYNFVMSVVYYYDGEDRMMNTNAHQLQAFVLSYELLIMNIDGTIAKRNKTKLQPEAVAFFTWLHQFGADELVVPSVTLATNQGSVGLRLSMLEGGWGDPDAVPGMDVVNGRLRALRSQIPIPVEILVSYVWRNRFGEWSPTPIEYAGSPEWSRNWRKPRPGMIFEAMNRAGVSAPSKALVVGGDKDRLAALAARTDFMNGDRFFASILASVATAVT